MNYVIGQKNSDDTYHYACIEDFMSDNGIALTWPGPCYQAHLEGTECLPADMPVKKFLTYLQEHDDVGQNFMLTFSVTTREKRYMEWLEAAAEYKGAGCCALSRLGGNGKKYTCYFVTIPFQGK